MSRNAVRAVIVFVVIVALVFIYIHYVALEVYHINVRGSQFTMTVSCAIDATYEYCVTKRSHSIIFALTTLLVGVIVWVVNDVRRRTA